MEEFCTSWRQFQLFSLLHLLIFDLFAYSLWRFKMRKRVFWGVLFTHLVGSATAVICKRCNWHKKRTIKTNSWKLFLRGFIQRLSKTGFTVLPYRFACILIYRHFQLLWTLPRTTPLPPTGRKNSMIDASADTSWMEWVWIVVLPILGVDGLMYTTLRWSHNDFSISQETIVDPFQKASWCISFSNYGPDNILSGAFPKLGPWSRTFLIT